MKNHTSRKSGWESQSDGFVEADAGWERARGKGLGTPQAVIALELLPHWRQMLGRGGIVRKPGAGQIVKEPIIPRGFGLHRWSIAVIGRRLKQLGFCLE